MGQSIQVFAETYLLLCQRYIELNPVRAAMVTDPAEYRWNGRGQVFPFDFFGLNREKQGCFSGHDLRQLDDVSELTPAEHAGTLGTGRAWRERGW